MQKCYSPVFGAPQFQITLTFQFTVPTQAKIKKKKIIFTSGDKELANFWAPPTPPPLSPEGGDKKRLTLLSYIMKINNNHIAYKFSTNT